MHEFPIDEAIFKLPSNVENINSDFPKRFGVNQQEELFRMLKEISDLFQQIQLEEFAFEQDKVFLSSHVWKEEMNNKLSKLISLF